MQQAQKSLSSGDVEGALKAVEEGRLDIRYVDECVNRVLDLIETTTRGEKGKPFDVEAHHDLAKRIADECVVLLKNDGILPLAPETRVALVGDFARKPRYQGAGSSIVNPTKLECVMDDTRNFSFNVIGSLGMSTVTFELGTNSHTDT